MSGPKTVTVAGRLSYPVFTAKEAYDKSQKGKYPARSVSEAKPDFLLLVTQAQWELFYNHVVNEFLPYCAQQYAKGEKKDALDPTEIQQLIEGLDDLPKQIFNTPAKPVYEKSVELAPEAVATIKCIGPTGGDIELRAIVDDEDQLAVPDPDLLISKTNKKVLPLEQTKHRIYPGAYVASTLNLYAYHNGKFPGFSAGVSVAVFKSNADAFGGSVAVDEDAIFMD